MARAVRLARRGWPAPNPHVGCVLVRDGVVVGEGWHEFAGGPHAEAVALRQAGERARGATAYVTLEPCSHHGRTPPCAEALVAAGVDRVVVAVQDPNPKVDGGGVSMLRHAGIEVEVGCLANEAERVNERFLAAMRRERPFVALKAACSLDGRIALPSGESRWITGERARRAGRMLRAEMGAVLVGRGTVETDDPALTVRDRRVRNEPLRVILDPGGRLGPAKRVFEGAGWVRYVSSGRTVRPGDRALPVRADGGFDLDALLADLFQHGTTGLLVEGGAVTLGRFLEAGRWDRLDLFVAPKALGSGPAWVEARALATLADAPRARLERVRRIGDDLWLRYRPTSS
ncbi:MAG: bifunctional diaminohydroxyphosphoribosylaminopyrimidine deaminase/5-amino-6-(5-phosphoribosylamino)uracil reductase RibD [Fimbriimonadaceae bacterium]|nr:bifunctional diaminohydroxyphosphoribosylaminopyrimidine deaminase/5-amino-6-(5-phosphoribosylamino)uracil reductase RibD [Fimbriimonadaceae bacterium]